MKIPQNTPSLSMGEGEGGGGGDLGDFVTASGGRGGIFAANTGFAGGQAVKGNQYKQNK
jgi:hypothetical protein